MWPENQKKKELLLCERTFDWGQGDSTPVSITVASAHLLATRLLFSHLHLIPTPPHGQAVGFCTGSESTQACLFLGKLPSCTKGLGHLLSVSMRPASCASPSAEHKTAQRTPEDRLVLHTPLSTHLCNPKASQTGNQCPAKLQKGLRERQNPASRAFPSFPRVQPLSSGSPSSTNGPPRNL